LPKIALLVEDDVDQVHFTMQVLREAGFETSVFEDASSAIAGVADLPRPVDLVVLDRRLPRMRTAEPADEVGDQLLDLLLKELPDTPFVIFTGYTGVKHLQFAMRERGVIATGPNERSLDRVCALEKDESVEFQEYIVKVASEIDRIGNIEILEACPSRELPIVSRRLLKRVASHFGGVSIVPLEMTGGLAGMPVWRCSVYNAAGGLLANVVVKQSDGTKLAPMGGLHALLPATFIAAPVAVVAGLCDGRKAQVMQLASGDPVSLMTLLERDAPRAGELLAKIAEVMEESLTGTRVSLTVDELVRPLGEWGSLSERLTTRGVVPPRGSTFVSARVMAQHGDLHPGNILAVGENPVLIDFDNEVQASASLDAVTALLSPLFHPDSPIRSSTWPSVEQCRHLMDAQFLADCPWFAWMARAQLWASRSSSSSRELWALVLGYTARQLKHEDVYSDGVATTRAMTLAKLATESFDSD